ncbi:MAG TPA: Stf0 family sulfotransferase [Chloroflexota bacterium]|nr:Stf0 family sulfotransferase [Chloroflexota bacterium]
MRPSTSYLVCYTSRSGSTFLSEALVNTGVAGRPEEYFNSTARATLGAPVWIEDWRTKSVSEALAAIVEYGTTENGVFGAQVGWWQLSSVTEQLRRQTGDRTTPMAQIIGGLFPNLRYIWVTRRDKVRQAVSLSKAYQSDAWMSQGGAGSRPESPRFNFHFVTGALREIIEHEAAWSGYFASAGIVPHTVVYEDLALDYEPTVRRVLEFLEIRLPEGYVFPAPRMQKQADAVSEEWVRRYYESERASRRWRLLATIPVALGSRTLRQAYIVPRLKRGLSRAPALLRRQGS